MLRLIQIDKESLEWFWQLLIDESRDSGTKSSERILPRLERSTGKLIFSLSLSLARSLTKLLI